MTTVIPITDDSPHLSSVKALWRENSETLGFYPDGAFVERARKGQILAACQNDLVLGYVLFYSDKHSRIRITHLCVSEASRGKGVARVLIAALSSAKKSCQGIGLYCRRDFPVWNLWPKLGFRAVKEKLGKSKDGSELTFFWQSHPQKTLFSDSSDTNQSSVSIVLDANVFYDILDPTRMEAEESLGLIADWLQPAIRLSVTPELFNEIQRNTNSEERNARMSSARRYDCVEASVTDFDAALQHIRAICGPPGSSRDEADQRQLAWTIASNADVFATRDQRLLDHSEELYDAHGLFVSRPADVISRFEEIRNEHDYQRNRLAGTEIRLQRQSSDAAMLADAFPANDGDEKKGRVGQAAQPCICPPRSVRV